MNEKIHTKHMVFFDIIFFKENCYDELFREDIVKFVFYDKPRKDQKPYIICTLEYANE